MLTRIITAVLALALFLPVLIFSGQTGITAVFALICGFGAFEMLGCCGVRRNLYVSIPSVVLCVATVLLPLAPMYCSCLSVVTPMAIASAALVYFMFITVLAHGKTDPERLMMTYSVLFYITAGFYSVSSLYTVFDGLAGIALVLFVSWGTDTFAYFGGMAFGKRKLCPEISPKKTVAGAVSGTICGTLLGVGTMWVMLDRPLLGLIALPLSVASQLGDLAASVIKRRFGVKDYGRLFPGHGGILDRFDSIIPVSVIAYLIFGICGVA